MKSGIHPKYEKALITCACGRVTETRSTVGELHVEICSHCHPFFTGRQKLVDTAGRVERFHAKYGTAERDASPADAGEPMASGEGEAADEAGEAVERVASDADQDGAGSEEATRADDVDEEAEAAIEA